MDKKAFSFNLTKKRSEILEKMEVYSDLDLINHLPYRYESFTKTNLDLQMHEKKVVFVGKVTYKSNISYFKGKMSKFNLKLQGEDMEIKVPLFNRPFYYNLIEINNILIVKGKYDFYKKEISPTHILFDPSKLGEIEPIYSLPNGIKESDYKKLVKSSLDGLIAKGELEDYLPLALRTKYRLCSRKESYLFAHNPTNDKEIKEAYRYLKYDELLRYSLKLQLSNKQFVDVYKKRREYDYTLLKDILTSLPYDLTSDQKTSLKEIISDLEGNKSMYRLLQGDVGMGKTLVASLAISLLAYSGYQTSLMAPTDVLARQHYKYLKELFKDRVEVTLLVGSLKAKEREEALEKIRSGEAMVVVGTHSLIQESVVFNNLSLAIIDEQHRFGVSQRVKLKEKGVNVDLLLMSATPIPRTLAISLFGNMDVSIINMYPHKERKVITKVINGKSIKSLIAKIFEVVNRNERVIIICSAIESLNKRNVIDVYDGLTNFLGDSVKIGLLHGKMDEESKNNIMDDFKNGKIEVLISTTVIEVGVDVKEASLIMIYDAESFGLAQLHQLRGRVGRNGQEAYCYLLSDSKDSEAIERLKFLENCNDGFEISRFDLSLRGPGELIGVKQAGLPPLNFASFIDDIKILDIAQKDAYEILNYQNNPDYQKILEVIKKT